MPVPVMRVGHVRMCVLELLMTMRMCVRLARGIGRSVRVIVMQLVYVGVGMNHHIMPM